MVLRAASSIVRVGRLTYKLQVRREKLVEHLMPFGLRYTNSVVTCRCAREAMRYITTPVVSRLLLQGSSGRTKIHGVI
jgi:hypothetical protein